MVSPADVPAANAAFAAGNPAGAIFGQLAGRAAGTALDSLVGGGGPLPPTVSNNASRISVAPVGVNVGEILRPLTEGSLTNGGFGLRPSDRFLRGLEGGSSPLLEFSGAGEARASPIVLIGLVAGGLLLAFVLARRRR